MAWLFVRTEIHVSAKNNDDSVYSQSTARAVCPRHRDLTASDKTTWLTTAPALTLSADAHDTIGHRAHQIRSSVRVSSSANPAQVRRPRGRSLLMWLLQSGCDRCRLKPRPCWLATRPATFSSHLTRAARKTDRRVVASCSGMEGVGCGVSRAIWHGTAGDCLTPDALSAL